jgi:hypothetical protein
MEANDLKSATTRWLLGLAAALLLATAAFHATGLSVVAGMLDQTNMAPAWTGGLKGLWLIFSVHLTLVAIILTAGAVRPAAMSRGVMVLLGLIPAIDAVALFRLVGIFVGDVALALATLCVFAAAALSGGRGAGGKRPA